MDAREKCSGGIFKAVRGPFSAAKLAEEGYGKCQVYGDPALLLPLVFTPTTVHTPQVGIIPHLHDYESIKKRYPHKHILNLNDGIEKTINDIFSCLFIVSTSLHGVIVAHAYGVPAIWVKQGYIYTDGIKFNDYFASVGIPLYDGNFDFDQLVNADYDDIPENIKQLMLPRKPIIDIQRALLKVAPFKVKQYILDKVNL